VPVAIPATFEGAKRVELCEYLIRTYSNQGDVVLDFTAGSFTTGIACLNTDREFIGIERDADIFRDGAARMKDRAEAIERMLIKPWEIIAEARLESSQRAMFGE